jgi:hypothetical protein
LDDCVGIKQMIDELDEKCPHVAIGNYTRSLKNNG